MAETTTPDAELIAWLRELAGFSRKCGGQRQVTMLTAAADRLAALTAGTAETARLRDAIEWAIRLGSGDPDGDIDWPNVKELLASYITGWQKMAGDAIDAATPSASAVARALVIRFVDKHRAETVSYWMIEPMADIVASAERAAVERERERCAKVAETFSAFTGANYCDLSHPDYDVDKLHDYGRGGNYVRQGIAATIRATAAAANPGDVRRDYEDGTNERNG